MPVQATAPAPMSAHDAQRVAYLQQLKVRIHQQLVERLDVQNLMTLPPDTVRNEVRVVIRELCQHEKGLLNSADQERLMDDVMDETFGLGPLEILLKDRWTLGASIRYYALLLAPTVFPIYLQAGLRLGVRF